MSARPVLLEADELQKRRNEICVLLIHKPGVSIYWLAKGWYVVKVFDKPDVWTMNETQAVEIYNDVNR